MDMDLRIYAQNFYRIFFAGMFGLATFTCPLVSNAQVTKWHTLEEAIKLRIQSSNK